MMQRALELARRAEGWTSPNPMVGAVLVKDGRVVGEGYHLKAGAPHAEVHALRAAGEEARGSTLYVSLEPCAHHGRTPPCVEALIAAGVRRVVAAMPDPNPLVAGKGLRRLREAGLEVEVGLLEEEARRLNEFFCKYISRGLPFVTMKVALTLDGKIATRNSHSRWITGEEARAEAHRLRHLHDAVLVGVGTLLADNPRLNVRLPGGPWKDPLRVVLDSRLRTPPEAEVLRVASPARTVLAAIPAAAPDRRKALEEAGAEVLTVPEREGRVDLEALLRLLAGRDLSSVLLEGGAEVNASALRAGLVDKVVAFIAPKLVGGREAPGPVGGEGVARMEEALELAGVEVKMLGRDLMVTGYLRR